MSEEGLFIVKVIICIMGQVIASKAEDLRCVMRLKAGDHLQCLNMALNGGIGVYQEIRKSNVDVRADCGVVILNRHLVAKLCAVKKANINKS